MNLRNPLFAPADSERKVAKALASSADAIILDLEDSIAPSAKQIARNMAVSVMKDANCAKIIVRINSIDTIWYLPDLAAVAPCKPGAILLPKCTGADDLNRLSQQLDVMETAYGIPLGSIKVLALATETVTSIQQLRYAGVSDRLIALCFGAEDLSADLGVPSRNANKQYPASILSARASLLIAAAEARVPAIDTPWPDPKDPIGLEKEARTSALDGFSGKLCIHPDQIQPVSEIFTPSPDAVNWAEMVHNAFATSPDEGVLSINGKMIDQPHLKLANRILATVGR